jgi:outer membrane lipoprotein SlyB
MSNLMALMDLELELKAPLLAGLGALCVETRNNVYRLHRGQVSGGIVGDPVRYATARREGAHLVVRDADGRLLVETSSVQAVWRDS